MRVVGIDPGLSGAIAFVDGEHLVDVIDLPLVRPKKAKPHLDVVELARVMRMFDPQVAVIERVGPAPGAGVSSMFRFGHDAGAIRGVAVALGCRVELALPAVWKPAMRLGADKSAARAEAGRRFPGHAASFARVKDDGRAEAVLLACWWRMTQMYDLDKSVRYANNEMDAV